MKINSNISNNPQLKLTLSSNQKTSAAKNSTAAKSGAKNSVSAANIKSSSKDQINSLMEQKEKIKNAKQEFRTSASQRGLTDKDIASQLATYDDQIRIIDQRISEIKKQDQENKQIEADDKKDNQNNTKTNSDNDSKTNNPQTDSDNSKSDELMGDLVQYSSYLDTSKKINVSIKNIKHTKVILDSEIKNDEGRGVDCTKARKKSAELSDSIKNAQDQLNDALKKLVPPSDLKSDNKISPENHNSPSLNLQESDDKKKKSSIQSMIEKYIDKSDENQSKNTVTYTA